MPREMRKAVVVFVCAGAAVLWSLPPMLRAAAAEEDERELVETMELSAGSRAELKPLLPHLGIDALEATKVRYGGEGAELRVGYEVWQDGKVVTQSEGLGLMLDGDFSGEIIASLRPHPTQRDRQRLTLTIGGTGTLAATFADLPEGLPSGPSVQVPVSGKVEIARGHEAAVWGYLVNRQGQDFKLPIEQALPDARWAVVVKARLKPREGHRRDD